MNANDVSEFTALVKSLWPDWKVGGDFLHELANDKFRYASYEAVESAMRLHRRDDYDAQKPSWKRVFEFLRKVGGTGENDFVLLLEAVKNEMARQNVKGLQDRSPADLWHEWLRAQTYAVTHDTIRRRPHDDTDGRRAKQAQGIRGREYRRWRDYLAELGATIPDFLNGDNTGARVQAVGYAADEVPF